MSKKSNSSPKSKEENAKQSKSKQKKNNDYREDNLVELKSLADRLGCMYLLDIMEPTAEEDVYRCIICKTAKMSLKSIKRHILESETHSKSITKGDALTKHKDLVTLYSQSSRTSKNSDMEENNALTEEYLEFLGGCFKAHLSFRQIQSVGKHLKDMHLRKRSGFLNKHFFIEQDISKIANIWGEYLTEELKNDLRSNKYSFSIDNTTITGINVCAIQARYPIPKEGPNHEIVTEIKNRIVGLKFLKESSDGETLYNILKEELFNKDMNIKNNLSGVVHDRGSNIIGKDIGALKRLKEDLDQSIFDLSDPCHSLNLALTKSLDSLPSDTMRFIEKIHSYFSSPQRVSLLNHIQDEEDLQQYTLCHYVKTRWLSLGSSLKRLLVIWKSLELYMSQSNPPGIKKDDDKNFLAHLSDDIFHMKIIFLSGIINKINSTNVYFQNQSLEVDNLAYRLKSCINQIAELFLKQTELPDDISNLSNLAWNTDPTYMINEDEFIANIALEFDNDILKVMKAPVEFKNIFVEFCQNYLKSLLKWLLEYLPLKDKIIDVLDFVSIPSNSREFKNKVLVFNSEFKIVSKEEEQMLMAEITDLMSLNIGWVRVESKGSSLRMWDIIESTYVHTDQNSGFISKRFPLLSSIIRTAHSLPTSSSNIEQSFSLMKLLKNDLRNNISEKSLRSLMMFCQHFSNEERIAIPKRLIELYNSMRNDSNEKKSKKRRTSNSLLEDEENKENLENFPASEHEETSKHKIVIFKKNLDSNENMDEETNSQKEMRGRKRTAELVSNEDMSEEHEKELKSLKKVSNLKVESKEEISVTLLQKASQKPDDNLFK